MEAVTIVVLILLVIIPGAWAIWGGLFQNSTQDSLATKLSASMSLLLMLSMFIVVGALM